MSGYTGTIFETLYASYQAATTTTPTAAAVSITVGLPPIFIYADYMAKLGKESSSIRMRFGGQMTATATVPTWQFGVAFTTTSTFAGTPVLATTATFTPSAGTGAYFMIELDIGLRTIALGGASTVVAMGKAEGALFPSPFWQSLPATGSAPTVTTWDIEQQYYLWPYVTLGAATAGNTVSTHFVKLYGEN